MPVTDAWPPKRPGLASDRDSLTGQTLRAGMRAPPPAWELPGPCTMAWCGMVEICEGAPVAVSGWVLTDGHDLAPCAANSLHRGIMSVSDMIGGTGTLGIA